MNTVLSSYNGLTLLSIVVTAVALSLHAYNGYSFRRHYLVMRGSHVVSRHFTSRKAHEVFHQITRETSTENTGTYDIITLDHYREIFA